MKHKHFLGLLASILVGSSAYGTVTEEFTPPLQRAEWFTFAPSEKEQSREWIREIHVPEQLYFRYLGERVKSVEIFREGVSERLWFRDITYPGNVLTPVLSPGKYRILMCASAGEQPCHIAVGTLGKLSWNSTNVIADFPASGGVLLRLNDAKKTGGLNAKRLALALGKYHQVAVTLSVNEPTTLILSLMQKDKNGEKVHFRETFSLAPGRHIVKSTVLAIAPYAEGSVDFSKDCTLHHFEITQIAAPAEPVKTVGNKTFLLQERAQEKPSDDPPEKPVFFRRPPRMVYEKSVPNRFERIDSLNTLAPTGEYAVFFFMLHNPGGTRSLQLLELDGFRQGKEYIPGNIFTVSQVRFWDFPRGQSTYFRIPEIIERQEPLTLAASSNCFYWIQGKIPKNAVPGTYTGSVSVRCGDELLQLPLTLEVPDLRLLDPENMVWSMYCNYRRLREYSATPAFQLRYLRDLTDYGISSVHFHISGASVSCVESIQKLRMASGLKGPVIIYGMFAEQILSKRHKPDPGP